MIMIIFWQEKIYFLPDDFHKKDIDCTLGKAVSGKIIIAQKGRCFYNGNIRGKDQWTVFSYISLY